jgi:hypothetical protein
MSIDILVLPDFLLRCQSLVTSRWSLIRAISDQRQVASDD